MKHQFLKDDELMFMVYYTPKKKVKMYELIYNTTEKYWENQEEASLSLLLTIIKSLNDNGFKCVEITHEHRETLDVYKDLHSECFTYRNIEVYKQTSGFTFNLFGSYYSCKTIENVINLIDRGLK